MSSYDACVVTSDIVSKATMTSQAPNEQSWHDLWLSMSQPRTSQRLLCQIKSACSEKLLARRSKDEHRSMSLDNRPIFHIINLVGIT